MLGLVNNDDAHTHSHNATPLIIFPFPLSFSTQYTQLIKSGSLEKGTAIKGMADVDLVLYFPPTPSLACSPTESPLNSPAPTSQFNFDFRTAAAATTTATTTTKTNHCSLEK